MDEVKELTLLALVAIVEPPPREAKNAIAECKGIFDAANGIPLTPLQILWVNFAMMFSSRSVSASTRRRPA